VLVIVIILILHYFGFYLFLVSAFYLTAGFPIVMNVLVGRPEAFSLLVSVIVSLSANIAAALFIIWNVFLISTNQSTIEFYGNYLDSTGKGGGIEGNPYNMGIKQNFMEVFGPNLWKAALLPIRCQPAGDGCIFPMNRGRGFPLPQLYNDCHSV